MAIYAGVEGVTKELDYVDASRYGTSRHLPMVKVGIDGVMRNLLDVTSQIKCLEIDVYYIQTYTIDSDEKFVSSDGYSVATANKYGTITIGSNSITVSNTTYLKCIDLMYRVNIVFNDGHKSQLHELMNSNKEEISFSFTVYGYEYFRRDGAYINNCMGVAILEDYVNNSASKTVTITNESAKSSYGELFTQRNQSGTTTSQQIFNSFVLNGVSFPITVVNNLKQKEDE